ncbi:hypothetical protein FB45DRAFT_986436 [Roridomyces roridus]|uniref:SH3 domain-containing protein n=1 Tax=Roridomyces roridus TaxID=1738132 RepID=A0AAD7CJE9_9AGAR|nr:hypothetical protein FB45DRAFT_986436 [Roridomyces roridus]
MPSFLHIRNDPTSTLSTTSASGTTYIAGIAVAGAVVAGLLIFFAIRFYRRRAQTKREEKINNAFTPVRGVFREDTKEPLPQNLQALNNATFSRDQLTRSVVLPEKAIVRGQDVMDFHRQSGTFPKPFTFALTAGAGSSIKSGGDPSPRSSWIRYSNASSLSNNRFSVISSASSVDSTPTSGAPRKVRQLFNPVLPDELLISLTERLTVVQAFDDGWVVVGRTGNTFATAAKSMFKTSSNEPTSDIELGVVPAWVFIKPVKGLRAERPVRSTSLGITVQIDGPSSRGEVMSWSNF